MAYTVLARKYRPRNFSELVGQEHVVQALGNALRTQRLHHAYLFTGTRGVGKTTVSRILAKSLNCVGTDGQGDITAEPCGVCQACTDIDQGRFVDYTELDAASNRGVDEVQSLLEQAVYKPVQGRFKVFMIDEVHMLTNTAFNAMLKTLEEPPEYLKFVLATTDPQKVPVTVLSRCLQFNLRPMPAQTVVEHLQTVLGDEGVDYDLGALRFIGKSAHGSMRDALSLTDQAIAFGNGVLHEEPVRQMLGAVDAGHVFDLIDALAHNRGADVVAMIDAARLQGLSAATTLEEMAGALQRMAVLQVTGKGDETDPDFEQLKALSTVMPADETQLLYSMCLHGRGELGLAPDEYAALTMVLLRLLAFKPGAVQASAEKKSLNNGHKPAHTHEPVTPAVKPQAVAPAAVPEADVPPTQSPALATGAPVPEVAPEPTPEPTTVAVEVATPVPERVLEQRLPVPTTRMPVRESRNEQPVARTATDNQAVQPTAGQSRSGEFKLVCTPEGDVWLDIVKALIEQERVSALVRELALQSQLVATDESSTPAHWWLRIENESLNQGSNKERLQAALAEAGYQVQLGVELGLVQDTPAKRMAAAAAQALREAELIILNDPFAQQMMQEFDAVIVPGTLKAVPPASDESVANG